MNPLRFRLHAFLIVALTFASLRFTHAQDVVRLGNLKFAHYGAISYMKELAPKYNLKIDEKIFAKGVDIIPAVMTGEIDITASGMDGTVSARAAGVPIYVVAGFSKGGTRIVGRADADYKTIADLKGKKVAVARGGAQELALLAELSKNNLTWADQPGKDVQIVYIPSYAGVNEALVTKSVDAMCQSEPMATIAIAKGFGKEIMKPYDTPMGEMARSFAMTEKMYNEKPDVALRVMKCFVEATKHFIDDPDAAQKYVSEKVFSGQLTAEDFHQAMDNAKYTYDVTPEDVQITIDFMAKLGVAKMTKPPVAKDFVRLELLNKAKQELGIH